MQMLMHVGSNNELFSTFNLERTQQLRGSILLLELTSTGAEHRRLQK
jgi:hypothetical protein